MKPAINLKQSEVTKENLKIVEQFLGAEFKKDDFNFLLDHPNVCNFTYVWYKFSDPEYLSIPIKPYLEFLNVDIIPFSEILKQKPLAPLARRQKLHKEIL